MKYIKLLILAVSLLFSGNAANAQYYYMNDSIVANLTGDSTKLMIQFNTGYEYFCNESYFIADTTIEKLDVENEDGRNIVKIYYNVKIQNIQNKINQYSLPALAIKEAAFPFFVNNDTTAELWLINEIAVKYNSNTNLEQLLNLGLTYFDDDHGMKYFYTTNSNTALNTANYLMENGLVAWACPNYYTIISTTSDPLYTNQYYLHNTGQTIQGNVMPIDYDIDAEEAWTITTGSANIKVAVIDDGVEDHEDMNDALGNSRVLCGYAPVLIGANCGRPKVSGRHGQACAGIIAASHNTIGVRGICPECKIVPFRAIGSFSVKDVAKSINKAWDDYACDVLSCSWSVSTGPDKRIEDAISNARLNGRGGKGSVVVFAAGNNSINDRNPLTSLVTSFPASYAGSIAVSAAVSLSSLAINSHRGTNIMIAAPSADYVNWYSPLIPKPTAIVSNGITTTDRMGVDGYNSSNYSQIFGGTSAAAPQVAGAAAFCFR